MFDVRPINKTGDLDLVKINSLKKIVKVRPKRYIPANKGKIGDVFYDVRRPDIFDEEASRFQKMIAEEKKQKKPAGISHVSITAHNIEREREIPIIKFETRPKPEIVPEWEIKKDVEIQPKPEVKKNIEISSLPEPLWGLDYFDKFDDFSGDKKKVKKKKEKVRKKRSWSDPIFEEYERPKKQKWNLGKVFPVFAATSLALLLIVFALSLVGRSFAVKGLAIDGGQKAYASLISAKDDLGSKDYQKASFDFSAAEQQFGDISSSINTLGGIVVDASKYLPFTSKLSSGAHLAKSGEDISQIGVKISAILDSLDKVKNPLKNDDQNSVSLLTVFQDTDNNLKDISTLLQDLQNNLDSVNVEDIPADQRDKFIEIKKQLPQINDTLTQFVSDSKVFTDILGGNGPRKYLFLFQNNQEMRATGGFIGTYGVLDIFNGQIKNFFVDGIFNPDGQLKEKVVPPTPIQKISAAWSLHDSNWWPDFPKSAEEASWFYEKTGGPTVDGVITMTPTVMQKLLEVTGPIDMPEYGVTVDKDNFTQEIQYEVEVDYDKELNKPKQILADLAPKILDKIFNTTNLTDAAKVMNVLEDSLNEKQILMYSKNYDIEKILSERGWSGEVLDTPKDYLSVINTNINGYKTDGMIDEHIAHQAEIQNDGSIIDTVTITRHHNGGNTPFEWWNKVNADYMRVYVPKGSKLISASGQTREFDSPPLDYKALNFKTDPQVEMEESQTQIDDQSGTRIYDDSGKTVFANWAYVSPQETVEIKYTYLLPFKIETSQIKPADTYSLLAQKQSGSIGSSFSSDIIYPNFYQAIWKYPDGNTSDPSDLADNRKDIKMEDVLETDKFVGVAFTKQ